ncbi:restriction endonuclease subunit S [Limnohabitans sp. Hippo3]|uniref:restriction endonuclease subunit S n=1 Tax=Limnohabitans sp. Hippo3 TaxID=1597956 RepID=UPI000D3A7013|nr:restriction endonuclease subunit S [Limnohabitans sp. Hippo3]PUE38914.1 restriction endonuclease subunit S [Limnohabitans sp. Hippo3]
MSLPTHWATLRLADVCLIGSGDGAPQEEHWFQESGEPFIRVSDLSTPREDIRIKSSRDQLTSEAVEKLRLRKWRKDSLLLPKSGASALLNQRALLGVDACVVSHLAILEPTELIEADFLYWWSTKFDAARVIPDPSYPSIRLQDLGRVKIALPTRPEQQRIVDVLRQADVVAKAKKSICDQVDHLIRTAYWEYFGAWFTADGLIDPVRISDYVADSQYGVSEAMGENGTHAVLRMNSMTTSGWLDLTDLKYASLSKKDIESTELRDGDLLFNRTNSKELVGKCAIWRPVTGAYSFASYLVRFRLKPEMLPEFLWATLNSSYGKYRLLNSAKQAVSMANVSPTGLGRITLPLPPLPLQEKFAKFVRAVEELRSQMIGKLDVFADLQSNVGQQALIGDLTIQWRKDHASEIVEASRTRDALLRERGTKITLSANVVVTATKQADLTTRSTRSARHWLLSELSEFQRQVLAAFTEYCQQSGQPLLVEDPDVFARFCDDEAVNVRLQAFGQSHGNRIRRSLSQLAALGLIAKITLPKQDLESGERDYLKAFRPLRPEEFTRMADVETLRKALALSTDEELK